MSCEICRRQTKLSNWESRKICLICKGNYYRKFDKLYSSIFQGSPNLEPEPVLNTIWCNFVKSCVKSEPNSIEIKQEAIPTSSKKIHNNKFIVCNSESIISCNTCTFRALFFSMPPPKLKMMKNENFLQKYLKFKSMWRQISSLLEEKYFDEKSQDSNCNEVNNLNVTTVSSLQKNCQTVGNIHNQPHLHCYLKNPIREDAVNVNFMRVDKVELLNELKSTNFPFKLGFEDGTPLNVKMSKKSMEQLMSRLGSEEQISSYFQNKAKLFTDLITTMMCNILQSMPVNFEHYKNNFITIAQTIYYKEALTIGIVQMLSSIDENALYQAPYGIYKQSESQSLQHYIQIHGIEKGSLIYKKRREASIFLSKRNSFDILLIQVKLIITKCMMNHEFKKSLCAVSFYVLQVLNGQLEFLVKQQNYDFLMSDIVQVLEEQISVNKDVTWYSKRIDFVYVLKNK